MAALCLRLNRQKIIRVVQLDNEGDRGRIIPAGMSRGRHRVNAAGIPGMAPHDAAGCIPTALDGAMNGYCLKCVSRT